MSIYLSWISMLFQTWNAQLGLTLALLSLDFLGAILLLLLLLLFLFLLLLILILLLVGHEDEMILVFDDGS